MYIDVRAGEKGRGWMVDGGGGIGGKCHHRVICHIKKLRAVQDGLGECKRRRLSCACCVQHFLKAVQVDLTDNE